MGNDKKIEEFAQTTFGTTDEQTFITNSETNHKFAIEYAARLFRVTIDANGPVKRREIHPQLSRAAVSEFELFLSEDWGDFPLPPSHGLRLSSLSTAFGLLCWN
jgi:hypothetical protein